MTEPESPPNAEELYHAALERAPGERAAFLDEACRGDVELRHEVESLLGYAEQARRLLDEPVAGAETRALGVAPGSRLGPYEVSQHIGAGGMGEVFRARDTKLGRDVALKLLPDALSRDRERLARFEREARMLASLNHAGIATLYGLEEHEGRPLLVMELVEGETLAARLERGPLERDEALDVFAQMAEALEAAHERGIIHRDLKPANVQRTPAGRVKLLDFGLAKTLAGGAGPGSPDASEAATRQGMVLGTAAYMSPEQARGQALDARTDLWSFGCVMYEALSGRRVFRAATVTETLAAVLRGEVEWEALPAWTPEALRRLLRRCLEREPSRRLRHAADARLEIEDARAELDTARAGAATEKRPAPGPEPTAPARWLVPVLGIAVAALAGWAVWRPVEREPPAVRVTRFTIDIEREVQPGARLLEVPNAASITIAPDGSRLAYVALNARHERHLYLRELDGFSSRRLASRGSLPAFSPDGLSVAFLGDGMNSVWGVSVRGGAPVELAQVPQRVSGILWAGDRLLLHSRSAAWEVPARGGEPRELDGLAGRILRQFLSETGGLLVTPPFGSDPAAGGADIVSLAGEPTRHVFPANSRQRPFGVRLLPTGHLVWLDETTLRAVRVADGAERPEAEPVPVLDGVYAFAVSDSGTLVYALAPPRPEAGLEWVDLDGRATPIPGTRGTVDPNANPPRLSPDGGLAALSVAGDIWVLDLERNTRRRLTFEGFNYSPVWSPDGAWIAFRSSRDGVQGIFRVRSDASVRPALVAERRVVPWDWSPDGETIASIDFEARAIVLVSLDGGTEVLDVGPGRKGSGVSFSPNGRWLAFTWEQGDRHEVYVRPFPGPGPATLVSDAGGEVPSWSPRGDELYYLEGPVTEAMDGSLRRWKAVTLNLEADPIRVGKARVLFHGLHHGGDVAPDGQRFLMRRNDPAVPITELRVVLNWTSELEREVP